MRTETSSGRCLVLFTAAFLAGVSGRSAVAAECRSETRQVSVSAGQMVRLRELACALERDPLVKLQVRFQRLDESGAGVLLNNGKAPWTERVYGRLKVLENPVLVEYRRMVQRFAIAERYSAAPGEGAGVSFGVFGQERPDEPTGSAQPTATGVVETVRLPLHLEGPLVDEMLHIIQRPTFPPSLKLRYAGHELGSDTNSLFDQLQGWRYLTKVDLDNLESNLERYNRLVTGEDRKYRTTRTAHSMKALALLRYLTADGLPTEFRNFSSFVAGEGCLFMNFSLNSVEFSVDVAFVHNASSKPVTIDGYRGKAHAGRGLREVGRDGPSAEGGDVLGRPAATLAPGETLVVPLRLNFSPAHRHLEEDAETTKGRAESKMNAERRYERIQATRPGTRFNLVVSASIRADQRRGTEPDSYRMVKTREAFTSHSEPEERYYAFGPEWALGGIEVAGERLSFTHRVADAIHFTVDGGAGSCPVLYVWPASGEAWLRHGKIIHAANGRERTQTESVRFDGWVPRFLIAEEELEVAHLGAIRAVIRFGDGTLHDLAPVAAGPEHAVHSGSGPLRVYAGEEAEVRFELPAGTRAAEVAETRLVITGYYDRYSSLLLSRLLLGARHAAVRRALP
ncbi:MAG: hypothetical protein SFW09_13155 [Hyphomicrobiaceae bacterium]|nr:hypothetical protein [Hyphomicrobiaceae bacterium]